MILMNFWLTRIHLLNKITCMKNIYFICFCNEFTLFDKILTSETLIEFTCFVNLFF